VYGGARDTTTMGNIITGTARPAKGLTNGSCQA